MVSERAEPHIRGIQPYVPGKPPDELARELGIEGAVKLASNESPLGPSPAALAALERAATEAHRYPDGAAYLLRQALARHHDVLPEELCFGAGSNEVIDLLCRAFAGPDKHAVIGSPSFVAYGLSLRASRVPLSEAPLRAHLYWDLDAIMDAVTPRTRLVFLDNPNNPTSTHIPGHALGELLGRLPEHVIPVVDEAYYEFADAADYHSALSLRSACPQLVVLRTFSKAFGLAGVRVGYAVGAADMMDALERIRLPFNINAPAQAAARAALDDAGHVARYVALNAAERTRVSEALAAAGAEVAPSQANFLCVGFGRPGAEVYDTLLRRGVIVRPLGPPLQDRVRITLGLPADNDRLLEALRDEGLCHS